MPKFTEAFYLVLRMNNKNFLESTLAGFKTVVEITLCCVRYYLTMVLYSCVILISFSFKG
jgi:hypothetical protein